MILALVLCILVAGAGNIAAREESCDHMCGNVSFPYPFGTRDGCFMNPKFLVTCNSSSPEIHIPYLAGFYQLTSNISLDAGHGEIRLSLKATRKCEHKEGYLRAPLLLDEPNTPFLISNRKNKFTVVGCRTMASIKDTVENGYEAGCLSRCQSVKYVTNGSCSGVGCCQITFPKALQNYTISIKLTEGDNIEDVRAFNPCSYAFLAEDGSFNFSARDLGPWSDDEKSFPVVFNWAIGTEKCARAKTNTSSYACGTNSHCHDSESGIGYLCKCNDGFQGNPYLSHPHPHSCRDIDECKTQNPCSMRCHNNDGNCTCSCPPGYKGDGRIRGSGCKLPIVEISLGITIGLLFVFMLVSAFCWVHKKRAIKKVRRKYFEQNGGIILQQFLQQQGHQERTKIFTEAELKSATNNFDEGKILGRGGQGVVYKGVLPDKTLLAIKKSRIGGDPKQIKDFINEIAVLSQVNHRNIVKLLGCCLETEIPLLVYEFVDNGTLLDHINPLKNGFSISWETRLQVAAETAEAVSYLHSSASIPIIHRDIKSTNILLDHNLRAKVSDFGASKLVPLDETHITTVVQGTLGYLDPEYLFIGQLNEKSDVYSFGVVLIELLTGKKAIEFSKPEQENLAMHFVSSMKEDRLWEILDKRVLDQKNEKELKEVALLARRCIKVKGKERPSMKEVAKELEGLISMENHPLEN
ncbi:putative wall-associated receptor kinase-like 16 isoform X1 [Prosopis cineraria]|uniref:putative wall-associated receptor kinase-like 16 isoform X1 n=1 Tax=Prosopis cineraria TaxID=364024 RepID=UPI00240FDC34|nr:putative wall-associated receptor kinase-like 16 isoform X1 [Prosopis cineraria]